MPAQGRVYHTINNLILLQYWLKLRNKLREGVNPQQSFNVKLVPQEKTAYTKYNNYLWVVVIKVLLPNQSKRTLSKRKQ